MSHEVVIEIPKGSRNKYEVDHETGKVWLDRVLFTPFVYPIDYGAFENTLGGDGDPRRAAQAVHPDRGGQTGQWATDGADAGPADQAELAGSRLPARGMQIQRQRAGGDQRQPHEPRQRRIAAGQVHRERDGTTDRNRNRDAADRHFARQNEGVRVHLWRSRVTMMGR